MPRKKAVPALNEMPKGFLKTYRRCPGEAVIFVPLSTGFLRLEYSGDGDPLLGKVSFVIDRSGHAQAIGDALELDLRADAWEETATLIAEEGVSGVQWSKGEVRWGHTYENDSIPSKGRTVNLDDWIDECIHSMINPPKRVLKAMVSPYDIAGSVERIKANRGRERFWKKCTPRSPAEAALVLELVNHALSNNDGDLLYCCIDPLKRAMGGRRLILEALFDLLEKKPPSDDSRRSDIEEVLYAHAAGCGPEMAGRLLDLCNKRFLADGPNALAVLHGGYLFEALGKVANPGREIIAFAAATVGKIEASPPEVRNKVENSESYIAFKRTVMPEISE